MLRPVFFPAPAFDVDGIDGCSAQFLLGDPAKFLPGRHRWKVLSDQTIQQGTRLFGVRDETRRTKDEHTAELKRELQRDIRWQEPSQLARLQTDLRIALDIR